MRRWLMTQHVCFLMRLRERDQLKAQLAEAQAMIAKLEQARDEAVSRIDWAIDSLHNVLESDA